MHHLSFALLFLIVFLQKASLSASPRDTSRAKPLSPATLPDKKLELCFYEKERRLVVLPLHNKDKHYLLSSISKSVSMVMAAKLKGLGYAKVESPEKLLCLSPDAKVSKKAKKYLYSRQKKGFSNIAENLASSNISKKAVPANSLQKHERVKLIIKTSDHAMEIAKGREALIRKANQEEVEYLLIGNTRIIGNKKEAKQIIYEFEFYDAILGRKYDFSLKARRLKPYANLDILTSKIQQILWGDKIASASFESPKEGAMIYLDHIYLGRTPLSRKILAGEYKLSLVQEGFESVSTKIIVSTHKRNHFQITNQSITQKAILYLETKPSGADAYFNSRYLGKTPLGKNSLNAASPLFLPAGTHFLRLSKEGYIDEYLGVNLLANKEKRISLSLKAGDTQAYYSSPQYAFGNAFGQITYFDLSLYSIISSLGFYGSWLYFTAQGESRENQEDMASDTRGAGQSFERARASASLAIISLFSAGYFLYQGVSLSHSRRFGEISSIYSSHSQFSSPFLFKYTF